ncbi:MAG: FAD-dependent oxidoreductase [Bdellovibrionota bacterium]
MAQAETFDVAIIGGGVNGTGIARDCALRGYRTVLLEKRDIATGASGANSGMIHGGARYMLYDVPTTEKSCRDSGYIQQMAPHMLFRIPFLYPVMQRGLAGTIAASLIETYFEAYDLFQPLKNGKPHTHLTREEALQVEPGLTKNFHSAITMDEWGIDPFRLCTANALSAAEAGAVIRNHTEVLDFLWEPGEKKRVCGVLVKDHRTGLTEEVRARVVFNASGAWVTRVLERAGCKVKVRPGKGVHLILDRRIVNVGVLCTAIDGRAIFIMPHDNSTIIGTTDDDYYGDLENITVTKDEIEYLLQGVERVFPAVRQARIVRTMAGIRPTMFAWGKNEDALSRDHRIYDHGERDGVAGLLTMIGGKLAAFRIMAEEATDKVGELLGKEAPCTTHAKPLPGGGGEADLEKLSSDSGISLPALERIHFRHGVRAKNVAVLCEKDPSLQRMVCACEPVTAAELTYAVRTEWAAKLSDLRRRTRLGTGPCQGANCTLESAAILGQELSLPGRRQLEETYDFLKNRWKGRAPIVEGEQLAQEELNRAIHLQVAGLHRVLEESGPFEDWQKPASSPAVEGSGRG